MGKKDSSTSNKQKELRLARKQEQRRIADAMSLVTTANKSSDLTKHFVDLLTFKTNDFEIEIFCKKVAELEKDVIDWAIDLTERNMQKLYENCSWGWNKRKKSEEMTDDAAWYLVAKQPAGGCIGFSHFRFDVDCGEPVVYCYEIQVEEEGRRRGLGARLLAILEKAAAATRMSRVRLTALRHNPSAFRFFQKCGYEVDDTSPPKEEAAHYEILSKSTSPKAENGQP